MSFVPVLAAARVSHAHLLTSSFGLHVVIGAAISPAGLMGKPAQRHQHRSNYSRHAHRAARHRLPQPLNASNSEPSHTACTDAGGTAPPTWTRAVRRRDRPSTA